MKDNNTNQIKEEFQRRSHLAGLNKMGLLLSE